MAYAKQDDGISWWKATVGIGAVLAATAAGVTVFSDEASSLLESASDFFAKSPETINDALKSWGLSDNFNLANMDDVDGKKGLATLIGEAKEGAGEKYDELYKVAKEWTGTTQEFLAKEATDMKGLLNEQISNTDTFIQDSAEYMKANTGETAVGIAGTSAVGGWAAKVMSEPSSSSTRHA